MANIEIKYNEKKVMEYSTDSVELSDIRKNKDYRDYIEGFMQYIDCEESVNTAILPHELIISAKDNNLQKTYKTTVENEAKQYNKYSGEIIINRNTNKEIHKSFEDIHSAKEDLKNGIKTILADLQTKDYTVFGIFGGWVDLNVVVEIGNRTLEVDIYQEEDGSMTFQTFDENCPLSIEPIEENINIDKFISIALQDFTIIYDSINKVSKDNAKLLSKHKLDIERE